MVKKKQRDQVAVFYGWKQFKDTRAIIRAALKSEKGIM